MDLNGSMFCTSDNFSKCLSFLCSSMYYDEDGDLAHEFYEETIVTRNGRKRAKLKRIHKNLIPQVMQSEEKWGYCSSANTWVY